MNIWDPYNVHATRFPPDPHHLQFGLYTLAFSSKHRCWVWDVSAGCSPWCLAQKIDVGSYCIHILAILPMFAVGVNNGIALSSLFCAFPASMFCVCPQRGKVRGGVGCPHSQGLSWSAFWSIWHLRWFSQFLTSICIHVHVCWPSTDRWWVLTALGDVSRPFSQCSQSWEALTDLGDTVAALLAGWAGRGTHLGASLSLHIRCHFRACWDRVWGGAAWRGEGSSPGISVSWP